MNLSETEAKLERQALENVCEPVTSGFGFTFDRLRK